MDRAKRRSRSDAPTPIKVFEAISNLDSFKILGLLYKNKKEKTYSTLEIGKTLKLTRKQTYSRNQKFLRAGLVIRCKGEVKLTTFGRVVMDSLQKVNNAIQIYSKLRAIDAVSLSKQAAKEEIEQLIDSLVQDEQIKDILKKFEPTGFFSS